MKKTSIITIVIIVMLILVTTIFVYLKASKEREDCKGKKEMIYTMPKEDALHEGTWITWPHAYTYGADYQREVEDIWVQMTQALHPMEVVHIIIYDKKEQTQVEKKLLDAGVDMKKIDFVIVKSEDVWVRDTGPVFVFDKNNTLMIADFKFDGWGKKTPFSNDDQIPAKVGVEKNIAVITISDFVLEGGSIEMDGNGTIMATKSSVISENRNPGLSIKQAEWYLSKYLGATNFVWLDGVVGEDITDGHIDGIARFLNDKTILTVSKEDFTSLYENISMSDYHILQNAKNTKGLSYELVELPLTKKNVKGLDYKGSYLNYYVGNGVVLVPTYNDENDSIALETIAKLHPERKVVPIMVNALFQYGGMIHCVTQQQPANK